MRLEPFNLALEPGPALGVAVEGEDLHRHGGSREQGDVSASKRA